MLHLSAMKRKLKVAKQHKYNKLFKSDSQRVAFLLCVGLGV